MNSTGNTTTLQSIMNDILKLENIMLSVRNGTSIVEVRTDKNTPFRFNHPWATIGDERGPWHIHVNVEQVSYAKFIKESRDTTKNSYSIRFFDLDNVIILRINFINMYDTDNKLIKDRLASYDNLFSKYNGEETVIIKK